LRSSQRQSNRIHSRPADCPDARRQCALKITTSCAPSADAAIADDIGGRFDHVLVDEYLDTNRLQSSVLLAMKSGGRGLTVVGDDAQSIYSFRAATVRNILDFPDQFSPKPEIVTLDRNYRSTQPILSAANGVIDLAEERFTKNLWTERTSSAKPRLVAVRDKADQARYIVERILESREEGALLKQQAVLFRTSSATTNSCSVTSTRTERLDARIHQIKGVLTYWILPSGQRFLTANGCKGCACRKRPRTSRTKLFVHYLFYI
jgi:DNA helicase IV